MKYLGNKLLMGRIELNQKTGRLAAEKAILKQDSKERITVFGYSSVSILSIFLSLSLSLSLSHFCHR